MDVIFVVLSMSGYVSVCIIVVIKCVKCGENMGVIFLITLIVIISLLVELDALTFLIMLLKSFIVGIGSLKVDFVLGIKYSNNSIGVTVLLVVNLFLILLILSMKCLFATLVIS